MTQPETITMTEVTNGQIDPAHYGPTGDIARHIASYCNGSARVHVYTAAFQALATARAEAEALREALTAHNLRAANGDEITVADELEQAASTLEAFVVADKEHPLLDCADDDGVEYQSEYMASLMDHATINARTLRKWAHSLRAALRARNEGEG